MRIWIYCVGAMAILSSLTVTMAQNPAASGSSKVSVKAPQGTASAKAKMWKQPRTPDGKPDFSGYWTNATVTPLERPATIGDKDTVSEEEAKQLEERGNRSDAHAGPGGRGGVGDYNALWYEQGMKVLANNRTSIITEPANGRIPALTPTASAKRIKDQAFANAHEADGPEDRDTIERCITWITSGPPMLPTWYNNAYEFVQSKDTLAVVAEMIHDARIIQIDQSPHANAAVRQWMGDSRGHWEGDTLVVETTNFNGKRAMIGGGRMTEGGVGGPPDPATSGGGRGGRGNAEVAGPRPSGGGRSGAGRMDEKMTVTERFTRTGPDILNYQFTVDDPLTYTKSWSGEIPMRAIEGPVYEYACHEGNYAMVDILSGARAAEKEAAAAATKTQGAPKPR